MENHSHFIQVCSCGEIISQCRCFQLGKPIETIVHGCEKCRIKSVTMISKPEKPEIPSWLQNFTNRIGRDSWFLYNDIVLHLYQNRNKITTENITDIFNEICLWCADAQPLFSKLFGPEQGNELLNAFSIRLQEHCFGYFVGHEKIPLARNCKRGFQTTAVFPKVTDAYERIIPDEVAEDIKKQLTESSPELPELPQEPQP